MSVTAGAEEGNGDRGLAPVALVSAALDALHRMSQAEMASLCTGLQPHAAAALFSALTISETLRAAAGVEDHAVISPPGTGGSAAPPPSLDAAEGREAADPIPQAAAPREAPQAASLRQP